MENNLWWDRISNARSIVDDVVNQLTFGTSVVLSYNEMLPWRDDMRNIISERVRAEHGTKSIDYIDRSVPKPGMYLLERYCMPELRNKFRPKPGYNESKFIAEHDDTPFHDRFLWVTTKNQGDFETWAKCALDYLIRRGNSGKHAVFLLEAGPGIDVRTKMKSISVIRIEDFIGKYDVYTYCAMLASEVKASTFVKTYLADLVSSLCEKNIELCKDAIDNYNVLLNDPYAYFHNREECDKTDYDKVSERIWETQIRNIYPRIEHFRKKLVKKYRTPIRRVLPCENSLGELIQDPEDVEIGMLNYLVSSGKMKMEDNLDRKALAEFTDARNSLSHLHYLSMDNLMEIANSNVL